MPYALRDGVSFCKIGGKYLFLDLHADRYFGLSPLADRQFDELVAGDMKMDVIPSAIGRLLTVRSGESVGNLRPCELFEPPAPSALDEIRTVGPSLHAIGIWSMLYNTARHLRRENVNRLIDDLRLKKAAKLNRAEDAWHSTLQAIWGLQAAQTLVTAENRCLLRSVSLARYLALRKISATLIIGVKLAPFSAHSWVQAGGRVLNDRHEFVRAFTPILVV